MHSCSSSKNLYVRFVYGLLLLSKQINYPDIRRVRIFGFLMESLTPSPLCMRTPVPIWVDGLYGLKAEQVLPGRISSSEQGLFAELVVVISLRAQIMRLQAIPHGLCYTAHPA